MNNLSKIMIFNNMTKQEIDTALLVLSAKEKKYKKNITILHAGNNTKYMGIVLEGSVIIENNDIWGNRTILSLIGQNEIFAETYALLQEIVLVDVTTIEASKILFLDISNLSSLNFNESWVSKFINNLLMISAQKNLNLSKRSFHISPKTIREKLNTYLTTVSLQKKSPSFEIPFDRQQLADYLNVERTALSKELGKMQRDGLIKYHKNHFQIIK